jgi:hypothetical protein
MQNRQQKMVVTLDLDFCQSVVNYLQTKPFGEVAGFMTVFSQAQPHPESPEIGFPAPPNDEKLASTARANGKRQVAMQENEG